MYGVDRPEISLLRAWPPASYSMRQQAVGSQIAHCTSSCMYVSAAATTIDQYMYRTQVQLRGEQTGDSGAVRTKKGRRSPQLE